jgi:phosphoglycolate phosphatase
MTDFPFRIVGFDLDGTLLDTHADLGHALNHALGIAGRDPVPLDLARAYIGGGARQMLDRALAESGGPGDLDLAELHAAFIAFYTDNIAVHTRLFPGGEAMLDTLAGHDVQVALVTNKLESLARKLLEELGLTDRFATIIGGDTLGRGRQKPEPDLLHLMVERLGGGPAAYVGDTTFDTGAARAAGLPCVVVRFGFNDLPADELGADTVIDHFGDLVPALIDLQKSNWARIPIESAE